MRALCVAAVLFGAISCGSGSEPTQPAGTTFDITTFGENFLPAIQSIHVHDSIRWTFSVAADGLGHNVLFKPRITGAPADIPLEQRSGQLSRVFDTAGEFNYVCDLHGGMTAKIIVQ
jgi:plastocyanin